MSRNKFIKKWPSILRGFQHFEAPSRSAVGADWAVEYSEADGVGSRWMRAQINCITRSEAYI